MTSVPPIVLAHRVVRASGSAVLCLRPTITTTASALYVKVSIVIVSYEKRDAHAMTLARSRTHLDKIASPLRGPRPWRLRRNGYSSSGYGLRETKIPIEESQIGLLRPKSIQKRNCPISEVFSSIEPLKKSHVAITHTACQTQCPAQQAAAAQRSSITR